MVPLCCTQNIQVFVQPPLQGEHRLCFIVNRLLIEQSRLCAVSKARRRFFVFCQKGGIFMSSDTPTINMAATGANIKALIKNKGLKVADVQNRCGFNTPQAIFKWMRGDAMPSIDNMVILAHLLDVAIDKIIILN